MQQQTQFSAGHHMSEKTYTPGHTTSVETVGSANQNSDLFHRQKAPDQMPIPCQ